MQASTETVTAKDVVLGGGGVVCKEEKRNLYKLLFTFYQVHSGTVALWYCTADQCSHKYNKLSQRRAGAKYCC